MVLAGRIPGLLSHQLLPFPVTISVITISTGVPGGQQVEISKGFHFLRVLGLRGLAQAAQDGHEGHQVPQDDAALAPAA